MLRAARLDRHVLVLTTAALLLALASGCAAPAKSARSSTEVNDAAMAAAASPRVDPLPVQDPVPDVTPPPAACTIARVHFAFDSIALDAASREELKAAAACLAQKRPTTLLIEGHCDERGTTAYNLALGGRRAAAVRSYLADLGVSAQMETISFGKELPAVQGNGEAAWRENRRAELRLPGEKKADGTTVAAR
jgi:peptidoglycan-associated lipoprotein